MTQEIMRSENAQWNHLVLFLVFSAEWNRLYTAAKHYAKDHNGENYFSALTKVSTEKGILSSACLLSFFEVKLDKR